MTERRIDTVVFDVGNVLIEWDPRRLYRKLLPDEAAVERFLTDICPPEWNVEQDRGRRWADAVAERIAVHPDQADLIRAFDARWMEMVPRSIEANMAILERRLDAGLPTYAITNFSAEKWEETRARFPILSRFDGAVVSAHERLVKPDPAIYQTLFDRHGVAPARAVFIDDSAANIAAAKALGMATVHAPPGTDVAAALRALGVDPI